MLSILGENAKDKVARHGEKGSHKRRLMDVVREEMQVDDSRNLGVLHLEMGSVMYSSLDPRASQSYLWGNVLCCMLLQDYRPGLQFPGCSMVPCSVF